MTTFSAPSPLLDDDGRPLLRIAQTPLVAYRLLADHQRWVEDQSLHGLLVRDEARQALVNLEPVFGFFRYVDQMFNLLAQAAIDRAIMEATSPDEKMRLFTRYMGQQSGLEAYYNDPARRRVIQRMLGRTEEEVPPTQPEGTGPATTQDGLTDRSIEMIEAITHLGPPDTHHRHVVGSIVQAAINFGREQAMAAAQHELAQERRTTWLSWEKWAYLDEMYRIEQYRIQWHVQKMERLRDRLLAERDAAATALTKSQENLTSLVTSAKGAMEEWNDRYVSSGDLSESRAHQELEALLEQLAQAPVPDVEDPYQRLLVLVRSAVEAERAHRFVDINDDAGWERTRRELWVAMEHLANEAEMARGTRG